MANLGLYHPVHNPSGSKRASDNQPWYNTSVAFNSTADCFNPSKLDPTSGLIGGATGRQDDYEFADAVYAGQVHDLRLSAHKQDSGRLLEDSSRKDVAGTKRGKGKLVHSTVYDDAGSGSNNNVIMNWQMNGSNGQFSLYVDLNESDIELGDYYYLYDMDSGLIVRGVFEAFGTDSVVSLSALNSPTFEVIQGTLANWDNGTGNTVYYILEKELSPEYDDLPWVDIAGSAENIATAFSNGIVGQWLSDS